MTSARETWIDWMQRGGLDSVEIDRMERITKDQLLDALHTEGVEVSAYDLENWQQAGIIPYGVRQRHEGATRLLYPSWMLPLLRDLRELQAKGWHLGLIGALLRARYGRGVETVADDPIEQTLANWKTSYDQMVQSDRDIKEAMTRLVEATNRAIEALG